MTQLRAYVILGVLSILGVASGCTTDNSVKLRPDIFVGDYVYISDDKGAPHDQDKLTLRADGRYILTRMPGGHPGTKEEGVWRLVEGSPPNILLDHAGYRVKINGTHVRLMISEDLGHWYEKTK